MSNVHHESRLVIKHWIAHISLHLSQLFTCAISNCSVEGAIVQNTHAAHSFPLTCQSKFIKIFEMRRQHCTI